MIKKYQTSKEKILVFKKYFTKNILFTLKNILLIFLSVLVKKKLEDKNHISLSHSLPHFDKKTFPRLSHG